MALEGAESFVNEVTAAIYSLHLGIYFASTSHLRSEACFEVSRFGFSISLHSLSSIPKYFHRPPRSRV